MGIRQKYFRVPEWKTWLADSAQNRQKYRVSVVNRKYKALPSQLKTLSRVVTPYFQRQGAANNVFKSFTLVGRKYFVLF
jgi:hypothetical protein